MLMGIRLLVGAVPRGSVSAAQSRNIPDLAVRLQSRFSTLTAQSVGIASTE
jgi:hypothetical protein